MAGSFNRGAFESSAFDVEDLAALAVDQTVAVPTQVLEATVQVAATADATVSATNAATADVIVAADGDQAIGVVVQVGDLENPLAASALQVIAAPAQTTQGGPVVSLNPLGAFAATAFQASAFLADTGNVELAVPTQVAEVSLLGGFEADQTIPVPTQVATLVNLVLAEAETDIAAPDQVAEVVGLPALLSSIVVDVPTQTAEATVEVSAASDATLTLTPTETAAVLVQAQSAVSIAIPTQRARLARIRPRPDFTVRAPERPLFVVQVQRPLFHVKDTRRPFEARLPL